MEKLTGIQIKELFLLGHVSAVEIATFFINRIKDVDPSIQAFLTVNTDRIINKAKRLDEKKRQGKKLGRLAGIPIGVKDSLCVKGELTTAGSLCLKDYVAPFSAGVVKALENDDALLIGKTNLDEFGMGSTTESSAFQVTRNPWDLTRSPGGSSGGSAAAVAANLCPIAIGTDAGGSIRQPAAWCGVIGFKPSFGAVCSDGLIPGRSTLEQIGPIARSIDDILLVMEVISPLFLKKEAVCHQKLNTSIIGVPWSTLGDLTPKLSKCFHDEIKKLQRHGIRVRAIDLPSLTDIYRTYRVLFAVEAAPLLQRYLDLSSPFFQKLNRHSFFLEDTQALWGKEVLNRYQFGLSILTKNYTLYVNALAARHKIAASLAQIFSACDYIAMPTTPFSACLLGAKDFQLAADRSADSYTQLANLAKLPAITLPAEMTFEKLPVGFQLIGRYLQDPALLQMASDLYKFFY